VYHLQNIPILIRLRHLLIIEQLEIYLHSLGRSSKSKSKLIRLKLHFRIPITHNELIRNLRLDINILQDPKKMLNNNYSNTGKVYGLGIIKNYQFDKFLLFFAKSAPLFYC